MAHPRLHLSNRTLALAFGVALAMASVGAASADPGNGNGDGNANAWGNGDGNRPSVFMPLRGNAKRRGGGGSQNLRFGGGNPGVVTGADKVYLVYWGNQWGTQLTPNDPSGQIGIQQGFFNSVGGSSWNNSVTQYCQGVAYGATNCSASTPGNLATNPGSVLGGVLYDTATAAPSSPTQSQLAGEAIRAAFFFGNLTPASNTTVQYVINTASGNNSNGFGTQWCAWHSSTSSSYGTLAYTNMPYMTDAGGSCGAGFNGLSATAGITIVGGHEFAETETDIFPNGGWTDQGGSENADKCVWISSGQGAIANVTLTGGASYPVQSLWSNAFNNGNGGCVQSYP
jgi:serine protease